MPIRGVIFDLDGTLVNSGLDFVQMRSEMGLAPGLPLLEAIERLQATDAERCWTILANSSARPCRPCAWPQAQRAAPWPTAAHACC